MFTKQQVHIMPFWQNGKLVQCHFGKTATWHNDIWGKMASFIMTFWQNGKLV